MIVPSRLPDTRWAPSDVYVAVYTALWSSFSLWLVECGSNDQISISSSLPYMAKRDSTGDSAIPIRDESCPSNVPEVPSRVYHGIVPVAPIAIIGPLFGSNMALIIGAAVLIATRTVV